MEINRAAVEAAQTPISCSSSPATMDDSSSESTGGVGMKRDRSDGTRADETASQVLQREAGVVTGSSNRKETSAVVHYEDKRTVT